MSYVFISICLLMVFFFNFALVWGIPRSVGAIYKNLVQTHKSLIIIYLMVTVAVTTLLLKALFSVSVPSVHIVPYLIVGSIYLRAFISLCMGNTNTLYNLSALATFSLSQYWILNEMPLMGLSWLPVLALTLLIKLKKNYVLKVLFAERCCFWIEFVSLCQMYLVVLLLTWK